jgi:hypothetical protein
MPWNMMDALCTLFSEAAFMLLWLLMHNARKMMHHALRFSEAAFLLLWLSMHNTMEDDAPVTLFSGAAFLLL